MAGVRAGFLHTNSALWIHGELANWFHPACLLDRPGPANLHRLPRLNACKILLPIRQRCRHRLELCKLSPAIRARREVEFELLPLWLRQHATGQKGDVPPIPSALMEGPAHPIGFVVGDGKTLESWRTPRRWRVTPTLHFGPAFSWDCQIAFISVYPLIRREGSFSFCAISPTHDAVGILSCPPNSRAPPPCPAARHLRRNAAK